MALLNEQKRILREGNAHSNDFFKCETYAYFIYILGWFLVRTKDLAADKNRDIQ